MESAGRLMEGIAARRADSRAAMMARDDLFQGEDFARVQFERDAAVAEAERLKAKLAAADEMFRAGLIPSRSNAQRCVDDACKAMNSIIPGLGDAPLDEAILELGARLENAKACATPRAIEILEQRLLDGPTTDKFGKLTAYVREVEATNNEQRHEITHLRSFLGPTAAKKFDRLYGAKR